LNIALTELEDNAVFAEFIICKKIETACKPVAEPSLQFTKSDPAEIVIGNVVTTGANDQVKMIDGFTIKLAHTQS